MLRNVISSLTVAVLALVAFAGQAPAATGNWNGLGGADTNVDTATNWVGGSFPSLTDGTSDLQFGAGGSAANINIAVNVNSVTFTRNANFSLERGASPGYLTIGAGGLVGDNSGTTARTYTVKQHVTASGAQTWETKDAFSKFSITGDVLLSGGDLTLKTVDSGNATFTFVGEFAGIQAVNVIGRIIFSWPATYTGNTTIGTIGNVAGGIANALPFGAGKGNIIMDNNNNVSNDAGVLNLNGFDLSINGLSGAAGAQPARVTNNLSTAGTQTLTVGNNDATATFNGIIFDQTNGLHVRKLAFTKVGSGTQTLAGANVYTGATTISGGTLEIGNGSTTGSLSSSSAIINNANLTINRSDTVTQGTDFSASAITGSGSLTQTGGGTLIVNAANSYGGGTTLISGTLTVAGTLGALGTGAVTIQGTTAGTSLVIQSGVADAINNLALLSLAGGGTAAMADQGYANLVASDIIETVGSLTLGGNAQVVGLTYGSLTSGAAVQSDEYFAGTGRIVVGLAGDFNGDHSVDAADYVSWRANPSTFAGSAGYDLWRANFGTVGMGSGSSLSQTAVPEPSTIVLLLVGMASLGLIGTGRRGKSWK